MFARRAERLKIREDDVVITFGPAQVSSVPGTDTVPGNPDLEADIGP